MWDIQRIQSEQDDWQSQRHSERSNAIINQHSISDNPLGHSSVLDFMMHQPRNDNNPSFSSSIAREIAARQRQMDKDWCDFLLNKGSEYLARFAWIPDHDI